MNRTTRRLEKSVKRIIQKNNPKKKNSLQIKTPTQYMKIMSKFLHKLDMNAIRKIVNDRNDNLLYNQHSYMDDQYKNCRPEGYISLRHYVLDMFVEWCEVNNYKNRQGKTINYQSLRHLIKRIHEALYVILGKWAGIITGTMYNRKNKEPKYKKFKTLTVDGVKYIRLNPLEMYDSQTGEVFLLNDLVKKYYGKKKPKQTLSRHIRRFGERFLDTEGNINDVFDLKEEYKIPEVKPGKKNRKKFNENRFIDNLMGSVDWDYLGCDNYDGVVEELFPILNWEKI